MINFSDVWEDENVIFTQNVLSSLEADPYIPVNLKFIEDGVVNSLLVLSYLAKYLETATYLEIGVRRGFSMATVAARRPKAKLVGFDAWIPMYAGVSNPGPDLVKSELKKVGHNGVVELISGSSFNTVPAYGLGAAPSKLIFIDGDHTTDGAYRDIMNCSWLLAHGGYMVVDDLQDDAVKEGWLRALAQLESNHHQVKDRVGIMVNR